MFHRLWLHDVCSLSHGRTLALTDLARRCFGAASAKERLDVVIRDAINAGDIPGPRYLANGQEIARRDGDLVAGITAYADGPDEMREVIQHHVKIGVDNIKLSMSGEEITEIRSAQDCYYTDEETAACVDEAHKYVALAFSRLFLSLLRELPIGTVKDFVLTLAPGIL